MSTHAQNTYQPKEQSVTVGGEFGFGFAYAHGGGG